MKNIIKQGDVQIRCHMCYGVTFKIWTDYHFHYESTHREESKYSHNHAVMIREKAMAEPINHSGRSKKEIVNYGEEILKPFIIKGYEGRGLYD